MKRGNDGRVFISQWCNQLSDRERIGLHLQLIIGSRNRAPARQLTNLSRTASLAFVCGALKSKANCSTSSGTALTGTAGVSPAFVECHTTLLVRIDRDLSEPLA